MAESLTKRLKLALELPPNPHTDKSNAIAPYDIDDQGKYIFLPEETPSAQLTKRIRNLWSQKTEFRDLNVEKLKKEGFIDEKVDQEEQEGTLTVEQLHEQKTKLIERLRDARNEFAYALDLVNVLLIAQRPSLPLTQQLPIPSGAITTTYLSKGKQSTSARLRQMRIGVAQKKESLQNASSLLLESASRLLEISEKEKEFWQVACDLRSKGWKAAPRRDRSQTQRSLLLSYSHDGSSLESRRGAFIDLRAALEGKNTNAKKTMKQFRVLLLEKDDNSSRVVGESRLYKVGEDDSLHSTLLELRQDSFDRELMSEISRNVRELSLSGSRSSEEKVVVDVNAKNSLQLELVEFNSDMGEDTKSEMHGNRLCELIKSALVLELCSEHRQRRKIQEDTTLERRSQVPERKRSTNLLQTPLDLLRYAFSVRRLEELLDKRLRFLREINLAVDIRMIPCLNNVDEVLGLVYGPRTADEYKRIAGSCIIKLKSTTKAGKTISHVTQISLGAPATILLGVKNAMLNIPSIVSDEPERTYLWEILEREVCEKFLLTVIKELGNESGHFNWTFIKYEMAVVGQNNNITDDARGRHITIRMGSLSENNAVCIEVKTTYASGKVDEVKAMVNKGEDFIECVSRFV